MVPVLTRRALAERARMLAGYLVGTVAMVAMMGAVWPTLEGNQDMQRVIEQYPESLMALLGGGPSFDLGSAAGFLQIELMGLVCPLLFILFAVAFGSGTVAGDEEHGLLELVQSAAVTRTTVYLHKAAALLAAVVAFAAAFVVSLAVTSAASGMDLRAEGVVAAGLALALLGWVYGALALALGAATGNRSLAISVTAVLALAGYLVANLAELVGWLEPFRPLSPVHQTVGRQPLATGAHAGSILVLLVVSAVVVAAGWWGYGRRDLGT